MKDHEKTMWRGAASTSNDLLGEVEGEPAAVWHNFMIMFVLPRGAFPPWVRSRGAFPPRPQRGAFPPLAGCFSSAYCAGMLFTGLLVTTTSGVLFLRSQGAFPLRYSSSCSRDAFHRFL